MRRPASTTSTTCSPASSSTARRPAPPTPPSSRPSSTRCSASAAPSSAFPPPRPPLGYEHDTRISLLHRAAPVPGASFAFNRVFDETATNAQIYGVLVRSLIRPSSHKLRKSTAPWSTWIPRAQTAAQGRIRTRRCCHRLRRRPRCLSNPKAWKQW